MSVRSRGPGYLLTDVSGTALTTEECEWLVHPDIAGVILFARNYENPSQLRALTQRLLQLNPQLIIAVDQEGGRLQRFVDGFSVQPAAAEYGRLYDQDSIVAQAFISRNTDRLAQELAAHGVNCNLLPVLDLHLGISEI